MIKKWELSFEIMYVHMYAYTITFLYCNGIMETFAVLQRKFLLVKFAYFLFMYRMNKTSLLIILLTLLFFTCHVDQKS